LDFLLEGTLSKEEYHKYTHTKSEEEREINREILSINESANDRADIVLLEQLKSQISELIKFDELSPKKSRWEPENSLLIFGLVAFHLCSLIKKSQSFHPPQTRIPSLAVKIKSCYKFRFPPISVHVLTVLFSFSPITRFATPVFARML
jgi:hypothetical protein